MTDREATELVELAACPEHRRESDIARELKRAAPCICGQPALNHSHNCATCEAIAADPQVS